MKSIFKILRNSAFALMGIAMISTTSCKDDIDTSNMYTFTGHMITDYLAESDSFQLYSYCLRQVYLSDRSKSTFADLLSARGNYTVFAPTDEAMHHFLDSIYNQTDFPIENCEDSIMEKIVRNCIIENGDNEAYRIEDLNEGALPKTNADDRYLTLNFDTLGGRAIAVINNDARVISSNLEMENGYVHACDRVVMLSNAYVSSLLEEAGNMRIFSMLLNSTGWADSLENYRDDAYEQLDKPETYPNDFGWGDSRYPQHRYYGYTVLAETDSVFHEKWGIDMPVVEAGVITNEATIREQLRQKCREAYPHATANDLTDHNNAENQFVAYHLLKIRVPYNWLVVHRTEYGFSYNNPTRLSICCDNYWETMTTIHRRLIKMTDGPTTDGIKINRCNKYDPDTYDETEVTIPGIGIRSNNGDYDNNALNGFYYPIDDILVYSDDVPGKVLNQRIRMDLSTYLPELINNNIFIADYNPYLIPNGYLEYVKMNSEETQYNYLTGYNQNYNDMYCDEHNITGQYDFTLRLPPVPFEGTWEVRLVYSYSANRGMAQLYFGTNPDNLQAYGLPIDERVEVTNPNIGWALYENEDPELNRQRDKDMRNKGYMMGCKHEGPSTGGIVTTTLYNVTSEHRLRKIFYTGTLDPDETYYIRFKSILSNTSTMFVLDYVEFAPKTVYNGDIPEDAW